MDPYSHPSAIPATPKTHLADQHRRPSLDAHDGASSSSSNFDPAADNGTLYSPAEVRSIDAVQFSSAASLQPALIPPTNARPGVRRKRHVEVNIESSPPSVPATPMEQAQESARHFSCTSPLPEGAAAPGSPAQSVTQLITRYTQHYRGGVEASLHYVLAIMNPTSGEVGVAQAVLAGLRDELGTQRVMPLNSDLFADPAPIRLLIKEQAVIYHPPGRPGRQQRGTVVVCGGDGTVSFIMTQMDLVQRELEAEFAPLLSADQQMDLLRHREASVAGSVLPDLRQETEHPYFTLPAIAPLPLGTGNDYSNCVGFGKEFTPSGGGCCAGLWALCGCGDGGDSQVAAALATAVAAPCVAFDRWEVSLVPLQVAQAAPVTERVVSPLVSSGAAREDGSPLLSSSSPREKGSGGASNNSPLWNRTVRNGNVANAVNLVDWERLYATKQVSTYGLINYFSVGYDAYVATRFAATRRAHPTICSTRTQNKAVYVSLGIGGAMRCKKLRRLVPMICVPRPVLSDTPGRAAQYSGQVRDGAESGSSGAGSGAARPRDLIALQLPSLTKSMVVSNVSCYGAGTHPWDPHDGPLYYRPVTLRNGEVVPSQSLSTANNEEIPVPAPPIKPVTINDRTFEVQSMGGFLHYSTLGVGLTGSIRLLQTQEMFAFVLCTPEDLHFPRGQCSSYTQIQLKDRYLSRLESDASVQASLCVQIDGEAMPSITEPTIIHMRHQQGSRILIRCRNASVVQQ